MDVTAVSEEVLLKLQCDSSHKLSLKVAGISQCRTYSQFTKLRSISWGVILQRTTLKVSLVSLMHQISTRKIF